MRRALAIHPGSTCPAVARIEVAIERIDAHGLSLTYILTAALNEIQIPPATEPARVDGLWRHTCFEAFIAAGSGGGYDEFNLSPSGQWAAYSFSGYRAGMASADVAALAIGFRAEAGGCELRARLPLPGEGPWRLGLSAVIEDIRGDRSYWALAHPPGAADFHHPDAFALEIA